MTRSRRLVVSLGLFISFAVLLAGTGSTTGAPVPKDFKIDPTRACTECKKCINVMYVMDHQLVPVVPGLPPTIEVTAFYKYGSRDGMTFTAEWTGLDASASSGEKFYYNDKPEDRCFPNFGYAYTMLRTTYMDGSLACQLQNVNNATDQYYAQAMPTNDNGNVNTDVLVVDWECLGQ